MLLASHLARSRHGVFQFRVVLPDALALAIGQKEIRRSLGTREPEVARLAAYGLSAKIIPLVRSLSSAMASNPKDIDPDNIWETLNIVGNTGKRYELDLQRGIMKADGPDDHARMMEAIAAAKALNAVMDVPRRQMSPIDAPPPPPATSNDAAQARAQRERAIFESAALPTVSRPQTIDEAIKGFLTFKKHTAPGTQVMYGRRLKVFKALAGGGRRMLHLLTEQQALDMVAALSLIPSHARGREIPSAAELLKSTHEEKTLGSGTIGDHITQFAAFLEWAIRSKHHPGPNHFKGAPKPGGGTAEGGAEAFTRSELEKIFDPALFASMSRPHRFWGPILGLFTGARSNELAQLRLVDFVDEGGLKCIQITHDPAGGTRTKNAASKRTLPLHPKLFEIGLQDYLDDLKALGFDELFPNLPIDKQGKREKYLSRDFNELHLKNLGIWKPRQKVFHSFRDTATQAMTDAEVKDFFIDSWLGHSTKTITDKHYRRKPLPQRLAAACLPALGFEFLNLDGIRYEKGRWNVWLARFAKKPE